MAGQTSHYGLTRLEGGESFSTDGYKYTNSDRDTIDRLLYVMGESHHHLGSNVTLTEPITAPVLTRSSGGSIPAGSRVYYKYSYLSVRGEETKASPESFIDMPAAVQEPGAPTLSQATTGGVLNPGDYYYVLSAYVGSSIFETRATNPIYLTVPLGTSTNVVTLTYPSAPAGMTGWNIYRRAPGEMKYFFLVSVASGPLTYVDNGSVAENCDRTIATLNTTNNNNKVTITLPGATPTVPVGYTWRIYRTFILSNYENSTLKTVVEYTAETTPRIVPYYADIGIGTTSGKPLTATVATNNPAKVLLTGGAEVQGILPRANVEGRSVNISTVSYTLVLTDAENLVAMNVATANNLTVPTNATVAFPVGTTVHIEQIGAGLTTIVAAGGVTLNVPGGVLTLGGQYGNARLIKRATNTWDIGALTATMPVKSGLRPTGWLFSNWDRQGTPFVNNAVLATGRLTLTAIDLPAGTPVTTIFATSGTTALSVGSNQWFALFDSARLKLCITADDTSTAWTAATVKSLTVTGGPFITTYSGLHYIGVMVTATTPPSLYCCEGLNNTLNALAPIIVGNSTTGLTNPASCPSTAGALTAIADNPFCGVG